MKFPVFIVDAFTTKLFGGNPAAVCPLENWLPDEVMQKLASENNLSETAFFVKEADHFYIRWFTPSTEVDLCGHATLAAAHVFYTELGYSGNEINFNSKSGRLVVRADGKQLQLDFPSNYPQPVDDIPVGLIEGLGVDEYTVFNSSFDYMVVVPSQQIIENLSPDFQSLAVIKSRGIIVTAKGDEADFVSRCFYPQSGVNEDPVTGSAHTVMVPYWAERLNKNSLTAIQLSKRRGHIDCELSGNRVLMSGSAVTYMVGNFFID